MRSAHHDGGSAAVEDPITAADNEAVTGKRRPGKPEAGAEILVVVVNSAGIEPRGQRRRVLACGLRHQLRVVAQTESQGQVVARAPFVLDELRVLQNIRAGSRPSCSRAGEGL